MPQSAQVVEFPARCFQHQLEIRTLGKLQLHDVTEAVEEFTAACALQIGMILLQSMHTTAGLLLNEGETGLRGDLADAAERLVPSKRHYRHDDLATRFENLCPQDEEFPNGHSHVQHALFGAPSLVLPLRNSRPVLGRWQRIFLVEFDRPRDRTLVMQALGVGAAAGEADLQQQDARPQAARTHPAAAAIRSGRFASRGQGGGGQP